MFVGVFCSLDDPSTGVSFECHDIRLRAVVWSLAQWSAKLMGIFQQLLCVAVRRVNLSARHKTVYSSCPQMLGSDTLMQSGVGVNSTCGGRLNRRHVPGVLR